MCPYLACRQLDFDSIEMARFPLRHERCKAGRISCWLTNFFFAYTAFVYNLIDKKEPSGFRSTETGRWEKTYATVADLLILGRPTRIRGKQMATSQSIDYPE